MMQKINFVLKQLTNDNVDYSYKILLLDETDWLENYENGWALEHDIEMGPSVNLNSFVGNTKDINSGFIHMCGNIEQLCKIIEKYYLNTFITIVQLDNQLMKNNLRFEYNDVLGDTYPHLYGPCEKSYVVKRLDFDKHSITKNDLPNIALFLKKYFGSLT